MISIVFVIDEVKQKLELEFPAVPRIGEQIYLADFVDDDDKLDEHKEIGIYERCLFVKDVIWMQKEKVYALIMLE